MNVDQFLVFNLDKTIVCVVRCQYRVLPNSGCIVGRTLNRACNWNVKLTSHYLLIRRSNLFMNHVYSSFELLMKRKFRNENRTPKYYFQFFFSLITCRKLTAKREMFIFSFSQN